MGNNNPTYKNQLQVQRPGGKGGNQRRTNSVTNAANKRVVRTQCYVRSNVQTAGSTNPVQAGNRV
jgi:hypothetical protein